MKNKKHEEEGHKGKGRRARALKRNVEEGCCAADARDADALGCSTAPCCWGAAEAGREGGREGGREAGRDAGRDVPPPAAPPFAGASSINDSADVHSPRHACVPSCAPAPLAPVGVALAMAP